jgi:hypothetical protein
MKQNVQLLQSTLRKILSLVPVRYQKKMTTPVITLGERPTMSGAASPS